ncbi:MerR family transcriptional regulator [Streptomyces pactum]|uniref:MerR family transcriptional regulator n=1 Tax=Streptomyces pactum TaxID=68249 RepID=UPI0036FE1D5A
MLIGEVARRSGVSTRMLRHYDALGLVRPTGRTVGGYREYSAEDVRTIFHVESLRSLGLSLKQIGQALQDPAFTPSDLVSDLIRRTEDRLAREQELLERLRAIDASAPTDWQHVLRIVALMRELSSADAARRQRAVLTRPESASVPAELLAEAILAEPDPHVAGALRWALARSGGDGVATLHAGTHSQDAGIRRRAVLAIAEIPEAPGATAVLTDALTDPDTTVRGHAALALGRQGVAAAVPALVSMVVEGVNDVDAAEVLGSLSRNPACTDRITTALVGALAAPTADSATRIRLTQALVEIPGTTAQEVLRQLARDDDSAVALVASALVGAHQDQHRGAGCGDGRSPHPRERTSPPSPAAATARPTCPAEPNLRPPSPFPPRSTTAISWH